MEEIYASLLLYEANKDISDRNLANLLETVGYDISLYDTDEFLTEIQHDTIRSWMKMMVDEIYNSYGVRDIETGYQTYERKKNSDSPKIKQVWRDSKIHKYNAVIFALLLQQTSDYEITNKSVTEILETAGLNEKLIEDVDITSFVREYHNDDLGISLNSITTDLLDQIEQTGVNFNKIKITDRTIEEIKIEIAKYNDDDESGDQGSGVRSDIEDTGSKRESVGINTKTVPKSRSSGNREPAQEETEDIEKQNHKQEIEKVIQLTNSRLSKINSLIIEAEFSKARQTLDEIDDRINEIKGEISQGGFDTLKAEVRQLEQKCDNRLSKQRVLKQIRNTDPYEFEKFVARIWERKGWDTDLKSRSGDRGVDVEAIKEDSFEKRRHLIQAKRHGENTTVSSEDIQRYASLYQRDEQVDNVFVVTSNRFTSEAEEVAERRDVSLIDGDKVYELLTNL